MHFAYQSFEWKNNAKDKAAVICIIIGFRNKNNDDKYLFKGEYKKKVKNINPYLFEGETIFISKRKKSISNFPIMQLGNMPYDGGYLHLSIDEFKILKLKTEKYINTLEK